jgi:hypothetical protein
MQFLQRYMAIAKMRDSHTLVLRYEALTVQHKIDKSMQLLQQLVA